MKFPYIEFLGLSEERIFRPMIPLVFQANKCTFRSYVLIDSGSDYTILPIEIAGKLKLKIDDQPRHTILGAGGSTFTIYRSPVKIEHIIQKSGYRDFKWLSYVYFAESGATLLLGQKGFLDKISVKLNGPKKEVEILP